MRVAVLFYLVAREAKPAVLDEHNLDDAPLGLDLTMYIYLGMISRESQEEEEEQEEQEEEEEEED